MADVINIITEVISNVGFPIAAFLLMFWQNKKTTEIVDNLKESINDLSYSVETLRDHINK